jgi:hypothetical protein
VRATFTFRTRSTFDLAPHACIDAAPRSGFTTLGRISGGELGPVGIDDRVAARIRGCQLLRSGVIKNVDLK